MIAISLMQTSAGSYDVYVGQTKTELSLECNAVSGRADSKNQWHWWVLHGDEMLFQVKGPETCQKIFTLLSYELQLCQPEDA